MDILNITNLKSLITFTHLAGLAFGLGGAWILDLFILKHFRKEVVTLEKYQVIEFVSKLVLTGLVILWLSGFLFVTYYYLFTPEFLQNQKVWAKTFIVSILSINGLLVHRQLLPMIKRSIGKSLLTTLSYHDAQKMLAIGTVSIISWIFPVVLGVAKTLNFSTPAIVIVGSYIVFLLASLLLSRLILSWVNRRHLQLQ